MLDDSYKFCYIFPLQFILYTIIRASIIEVLTHLFRKAIWVLRHCQTAICTCNIVPEIHFLLKRSLLSFTTVTVPYLNGLFYFTQIKRVVKYLRMNNHNVFICCSFKWKQFYSMENEIHSWMSPSCVAWQFFFQYIAPWIYSLNFTIQNISTFCRYDEVLIKLTFWLILERQFSVKLRSLFMCHRNHNVT